MERFELEPQLCEEIRARVLGEGFMKLVQTVRRNGKTFRIALRPVAIGGERKFQAEMTDDGQGYNLRMCGCHWKLTGTQSIPSSATWISRTEASRAQSDSS